MHMTKSLYELLVKLTEVASDGAEARKADAATAEDRLAAVDAANTVTLGEFYVEEFAEQYRHGDLS